MELALTEERPARGRQSRAEPGRADPQGAPTFKLGQKEKEGPSGRELISGSQTKHPSEQPEVMGSGHSGETSGGGWS